MPEARERGFVSSTGIASSASPGSLRRARWIERYVRAEIAQGSWAGRDRLLEEVQRARDVRLHEVAAAVGAHVRLVQRRRVQDGVDTAHRSAHEGAVGDRADELRPLRLEHVEADDVHALGREYPYERLPEVARAAGDEHAHRRKT